MRLVRIAVHLLSGPTELFHGNLRTKFLESAGAKGRFASAGLRSVREVTETSISPPGCFMVVMIIRDEEGTDSHRDVHKRTGRRLR